MIHPILRDCNELVSTALPLRMEVAGVNDFGIHEEVIPMTMKRDDAVFRRQFLK